MLQVSGECVNLIGIKTDRKQTPDKSPSAFEKPYKLLLSHWTSSTTSNDACTTNWFM